MRVRVKVRVRAGTHQADPPRAAEAVGAHPCVPPSGRAVRDLLCARYDLGAFRQLAPEFSAVDPEPGLAKYFALDSTQAIQDELARNRALACKEGLVARGVPATRLVATWNPKPKPHPNPNPSP